MASSTKAARRPAPANNFLEALRDLGKGVVSDAKSQILGGMAPGEAYSLDQLKAAEAVGERRAETRFNNRLQDERLVFLRSEQESKKQIASILQEIQILAKSTGELAREVQVATMQAPANPGVYHRSFFEQLRSLIKSIKMRVQESRHWLATTNARAAKRGYYWGQVKSSGTKFMLSQERYMVTSTG